MSLFTPGTEPPPGSFPNQPSSPYPPLQPPPRKKRSRRRLWLSIAAGLVVFVLVCAVIAGMTGQGPSPSPTSHPTQPITQRQSTPASQPTVVSQPTQMPTTLPSPTQAHPSPSPTPTFLTFGDGTNQVGTDIQPGTYRTQTGSQGCYYARLSGFGGTVGDILANNLTDAPAIVTIKPTDKGFSSQNCGTWTSDLSQITTSKTSFDDGIYIVGTDITPGTYKDTGGDSCYYARLSGFGNTVDDIIANGLASAPTIVTIAASDKGFQSHGCGTWTKI